MNRKSSIGFFLILFSCLLFSFQLRAYDPCDYMDCGSGSGSVTGLGNTIDDPSDDATTTVYTIKTIDDFSNQLENYISNMSKLSNRFGYYSGAFEMVNQLRGRIMNEADKTRGLKNLRQYLEQGSFLDGMSNVNVSYDIDWDGLDDSIKTETIGVSPATDSLASPDKNYIRNLKRFHRHDTHAPTPSNNKI